MTDLAKLVVRLEAESARLQKDLETANKRLGQFETQTKKSTDSLKLFSEKGRRDLNRLALGIKVFVTSSTYLLQRLVSAQADVIDEQAKMARALGGTSGGMQALTRTASRARVEMNELHSAVTRLNQRLGEAIIRGGPTADVLDKLGLSAEKLSRMDVDERFAAISQRMSELGLSTQITASYLRDLGIRQASVITLMQEGAEAIRQSQERLRQYGVLINDLDSSKVEAMNDAFSELSIIKEGFLSQLTVQLAGPLEAIANELAMITIEYGGVENAAISAYESIISGTVFVVDAIDGIGRAFVATANTGVATFATVSGSMSLWANRVQRLPTVRLFFTDEDRAATKRNADLMQSVLSQSLDKMEETLNRPMAGQRFKAFAEEAQARAGSNAEALAAARALAAPVTYSEDFIGASVGRTKTLIKQLEKEMKDAATRSEKLSSDFQNRFDRITKTQFNAGTANTIDVGFLELQAERALKAGDIDGATKSLNHAFDVLDAMKSSGSESSIVLEGLATRLKRVGDQLAEQNLSDMEAKIKIDLSGAIDAAREGNEAMQALLDANPLTQKLLIDSSLIPTGPMDVHGQGDWRPANINLPDGRSMQVMFDNQDDVDYWQREFSREATKRGARK
ncbi:hypothetical protein [Methylophaga lonarensis]|uniref:hypothetical protein n=1 Tax=Methylophaga lonarensis TaxID=999151 RepID=UPI003D2B8B21